MSDFKLSGFVILVFSKQKGITVVFRNDPLESLKVSSTFDSIPFVRDFLQKEIEAQLRILFMDELPAIIHRLSLRLWVPDYRGGDEANETDNTEAVSSEGPGQDPLASPPQDPVDSLGNALNETEIASLSLDSSVETHSLFSQKNLLRLAALTDSQRTLSLFTPSINEVVYRAWTCPPDPSEFPSSVISPLSPTLSRAHSHVGSMSSSLHETASNASLHSRSSVGAQSFNSYGLNLGAGRHSKSHSRRRKRRVVDMRRPKTTDDAMSVSDDSSMRDSSSPPSIYSAPLPIVSEQADDPVTPPLGPEMDSLLPSIPERHRASLSRPKQPQGANEAGDLSYSLDTIRASRAEDVEATPRATIRGVYPNEKAEAGPSRPPLPATVLPFSKEDKTEGPVDNLLVERLAGEIARRMREEKMMTGNACSNFWSRVQDDAPPPAYGH